MCYLMTHTTHFIIVGHMVMEHSDKMRGNLKKEEEKEN